MIRNWIAAAAIAAAALMAAVPAAAENSVAVRQTAPAVSPRTYEGLAAALTAADLDQIVTDARASDATGEASATDLTVLLLDAILAGDERAVRRYASAGEGRAPNLFSPFDALGQGRFERALTELQDIAGRLPAPLPDFGTALMLEAAGRFEDAALVYRILEQDLVVEPLDGEPRSADELERLLGEARTATILFRAGQVQHRLGAYDEARRFYALARAFTPQSARLASEEEAAVRRRPPTRQALTADTALAQWLFVLADFANNTEGLARIFASDVPLETLASPTAALYFQFGVLFDPGAEEYVIAAASQLADVRGFEGADRILSRIGDRSPFMAEAALSRAGIALERRDDAAARRFAQSAARAGQDRWAVLAGAADVLIKAGADREAQRTLDRALTLSATAEDRARVLSLRALAWRHLGDLDRAVADAREAMATDRSDETRFAAIAVMMEHPVAWADAVAEARSMLSANPDSVLRLNALGYTLIQRPEGLEEGFRLLWRGYALNDRNDALVDSLGWAYYLYGQFDEALDLIERANALTGDDPNAEILDHLGDVRWRMSDPEGAREAWRQALQAWPDAPRRRSLEQKLSQGLTSPAPETREPPTVVLPNRDSRRQEET